MATQAKVVEDGVSDGGPGSRPKSKWLLIGVAFGLGLAVATLIEIPTGDPENLETATEGAVPDEPVSVVGTGISAAVPGFSEALVAVENPRGSGLHHLIWPVSGSPLVRTLMAGSDVGLDAAGRYLAMSTSIPDMDGQVLSMGTVDVIRPVAAGVTSYAWHDSATGQLAYTTMEDGEWHLYTITTNHVVSLVTSQRPEDRKVAAWGDWGFALQGPENEVILMTAGGDLKTSERGRVLGSRGDGWMLVEDAGLKLVSSGGGVSRLEGLSEVEEIRAATFSPDGGKVALAGPGGVTVVGVHEWIGELTLSPRYPSHWVSWSSDSRFVLAPAQSGILIHDLETGETYSALIGRSILAADVVPLTGS